MAKVCGNFISIKIDCTVCGKKFTHTHDCDVFDAKRYEDWAHDNITMCPQCYNLKQAIQQEYEGIADLEGTEKQINYARQIRAKVIHPILNHEWWFVRQYMYCLGFDDNAIKSWRTEYRIADEQARISALKNLIDRQTSAVWWIKNESALR